MKGTRILMAISDARTSLLAMMGKARLFHVTEIKNVNWNQLRPWVWGMAGGALTMIKYTVPTVVAAIPAS